MHYFYQLQNISEESYKEFLEVINKAEESFYTTKRKPALDIYIHSDGGWSVISRFIVEKIIEVSNTFEMHISLWAWCSAWANIVVWLLEAWIEMTIDDCSYLMFHIGAMSLHIGHNGTPRWQLERALSFLPFDEKYEPWFKYLTWEERKVFMEWWDVFMAYPRVKELYAQAFNSIKKDYDREISRITDSTRYESWAQQSDWCISESSSSISWQESKCIPPMLSRQISQEESERQRRISEELLRSGHWPF